MKVSKFPLGQFQDLATIRLKMLILAHLKIPRDFIARLVRALAIIF